MSGWGLRVQPALARNRLGARADYETMRPCPLLEVFVRTVLALLAPGSCAACGRPPEPRFGFCAACGPPLPAARGDVAGVPIVAAGAYAPPLSDAIANFKFQRRPELAEPLSRLLLSRVEELEIAAGDACVPVPLHRTRLVERGFNQSALLARALARQVGARFEPLLLERRRGTAQQARLGREARAANALDAFRVRKPFRGGRIVLVDDVVTTGATARACLDALAEQGIAVLAVVALAHGSSRSC